LISTVSAFKNERVNATRQISYFFTAWSRFSNQLESSMGTNFVIFEAKKRKLSEQITTNLHFWFVNYSS